MTVKPKHNKTKKIKQKKIKDTREKHCVEQTKNLVKKSPF